MARSYKSLFAPLLLLSLLLSSCQEGGDAGDLFGQWRLSGSDTQYISFSGSIVWMKNLKENELYGNFQHVGDSLFIQCYSIKEQQTDTTIVEESYGFRPFNNIRLKIESIDDDNLLISKGDRKWSFYKY